MLRSNLVLDLLEAPGRLLAKWRFAIRASAGKPGIRCGLCEIRPRPGERFCDECNMELMTAP